MTSSVGTTLGWRMRAATRLVRARCRWVASAALAVVGAPGVLAAEGRQVIRLAFFLADGTPPWASAVDR